MFFCIHPESLILGAGLLVALATGSGCANVAGTEPTLDAGGLPDLSPTLPMPLAFAPAVSRPSGTHPSAIAAEDVNGDGGPELIVANQGDNSVTVLMHNQDYRANTPGYTTAAAPSGLAVGDINQDGKKDLLVACNNSYAQDLSVLRNSGNGTFLPPVHFALSNSATAVVASDFNGDGRIDVAVSTRSQGSVFVLLNSSLGAEVAFTAPYGIYNVGSDPVALLAADLNHDGRADLISASYRDNQIGVLTGLAPSRFAWPSKVAWVGMGPTALVAGELTGDGNQDLAVANLDDNSVSLLSGRGDATFSWLLTLPTAAKPTALAIADMDQDGHLDLVVANSGANLVSVLRGTGSGMFAPAQTFAVGEQPFALVVADLDLDGRPDIATANMASGDVSILYNRIAR